MSEAAVGGQTEAGATEERILRELEDVGKTDQDAQPVKVGEENRFQRAITAWRSM